MMVWDGRGPERCDMVCGPVSTGEDQDGVWTGVDRGCGWKREGCDTVCGPKWTGGVDGRWRGAMLCEDRCGSGCGWKKEGPGLVQHGCNTGD